MHNYVPTITIIATVSAAATKTTTTTTKLCIPEERKHARAAAPGAAIKNRGKV